MFEPGRTWIVGVVNVTPDSFSDGGRYYTPEAAIEHGLRLAAEGADVLDVGGESTRPGARPVPLDEELRRVLPVVEGLRAHCTVPVSIDTRKAEVARQALAAGAAMVNDVSGLQGDPEMADVVARYGAWACIMHMQGTPETMQDDPHYDDVVREVADWLRQAVERAVARGVRADRILVDPGVGFGKRLSHNLRLIRHVRHFEEVTGCPVLMGVSRKRFIGELTGQPVEAREFGTAAAVAACVLGGARAVRVHDVRAARDVVSVADAIARTP